MMFMDKRRRTDVVSVTRWVAGRVTRRVARAIELYGKLPKSEYRSIVKDLVTALATPCMPAAAIYCMSLGAFPTLVKETLEAPDLPDLGALPVSGEPVLPEPVPYQADELASPEPAPWEDDELDPVDAQWYFDLPSVRLITNVLPADTTSVVALGTPTVAAVAAESVPQVTLVDISPRFRPPGLPPWVDGKGVETVSHNLDEKPYEGTGNADVVVMDPPWYIENYRAWLHSAVASCRQDGLIVVALPQVLTNRRAVPEREEVLELLKFIGSVEMMENVLTYVTPSFELAVLEADDLQFLRRWRRADLALVKVKCRQLPYEFPWVRDIEWVYREVRGRVVRSCYEPENSSGLPIINPTNPRVESQPTGSTDPRMAYRLTSVGRSYLWSCGANLVTSRGRAAAVQRWGALPQILARLQEDEDCDLDSAVRDELPGVSAEDCKPLADILRTLLES
jgi:hypothetical protein